MQRTIHQNKTLHAIITKLGIDEDLKREMIHNFSKLRTTKSSELTYYECNELLNYLNKMQADKDKQADAMRKKLLSIAHEMQWELPDGSIDWIRLDAWLHKYGYLHKDLNKYNIKELPTLLTQFENILKHYYASR